MDKWNAIKELVAQYAECDDIGKRILAEMNTLEEKEKMNKRQSIALSIVRENDGRYMVLVARDGRPLINLNRYRYTDDQVQTYVGRLINQYKVSFTEDERKNAT